MHEEELIAEYIYNQAQTFLKETVACADELIEVLQHFADNENGHLSALALAAAKVAGKEDSDKFRRLFEKSLNAKFCDDD